MVSLGGRIHSDAFKSDFLCLWENGQETPTQGPPDTCCCSKVANSHNLKSYHTWIYTHCIHSTSILVSRILLLDTLWKFLSFSYTPKVFSMIIPGELITLDRRYQHTIGQREKLSFYDTKLANIMYDCAAKLKCSRAITCSDDGYIGPGCKCYCKSGDSTCTRTKAVESKTTEKPKETRPEIPQSKHTATSESSILSYKVSLAGWSMPDMCMYNNYTNHAGCHTATYSCLHINVVD